MGEAAAAATGSWSADPLNMERGRCKYYCVLVLSILTLVYEADFTIYSYYPLAVTYLDLEAPAHAVGEVVATGRWSADPFNMQRRR